ncbi:MAG: efflux RND transporter periplasmic adaptor subunit [Acidiferrobacterales bacterium]|nr:efflux RND transporter periplasmic adaptor subunit [Acidiferrobacterales bacterium]
MIYSTKYLPLFFISVFLVGCEEPKIIEEAPMRSVRYVEIVSADASRIRTFTGVSQSTQETSLSFKVGGTITELSVSVGEKLSKGQKVARLDSSTYSLQLQQSQADLARAQAEQRNAASAYERVKGLYENRSASKNELDTARAGAESARAQVAASSRSVELARLNMAYTTLSAKEDCTVVSTAVNEGENISAGQQVAVVSCGEGLEVNVSVPESLIGSIQEGLSVSTRFAATNGQAYAGTVTEVGIAATGTTFPVTINLEDPQNLRSGMAAQVDFQFDTVASLPVVPSAAVSEDQGGRFIYLLEPNDDDQTGTVKRQNIKIGELNSRGLEVSEGVSAGDLVITAGVSKIRDGLIVKVTPQ